MKKTWILSFLTLCAISDCAGKISIERSIENHLQNRNATFVLLDLDSEQRFVYNEKLAAAQTTPCSTFKIWNTLIGAENHYLVSPDQPFYRWDGKVREIPEWNKDLTLSEAFKVSCVPAFQDLARRTGRAKMETWIRKLSYGNEDLSSGIDDFWLPRRGKASIQISPLEQALLIRKLVREELPFSENSRNLLYKIMLVRQTPRGKLYGKTGTGSLENGENLGWFVGFVQSATRRLAFACLLKSSDASGATARALTIQILEESETL